MGPQISIFRIAPFLLNKSSLDLSVLLLNLSRVFCANLAPEKPVVDPSLFGPLIIRPGQLSSVHAPPPSRRHQGGAAWFRQIDAAPWPSRWPCGEEPEEKENPFELFAETEILAEDCLGHESQTIFRQNLSFGEQLKRVLFFFRLFARGLATLDRAVRSHTHHIINKHAPNLTQDLAHQPLLPLTPKRLSHSPSKKHATRDTALFTRRQCSEQKRKR